MSKWGMVMLGDMCQFINGDRGKNYPSAKDFVSEGIPFVNAGHIVNNEIDFSSMNYINVDSFNKLGSGKLQENDIIFCLRGSLGKHAIVSIERGAIASSLVILRKKTERLHNKYLSYSIISKGFNRQLSIANNGSSQPNLSAASVKKFEIPLPPLETQKQIAKTLDTTAELLAMRKQQLAELDNLIKSTFYNMFGDPVANGKGWGIRKLKDITVSIQSGNTPKGGEQVYVDSGIMFFRSQNVWRNRIEISDIAYIDEKTHRNMGKTSLNHKDILITKTGRFNTENSSLGRAALFLGEDRSANINGHVYLVRLKEGYVHEFILHILITDEYKDYIRTVCVGGIDKRQINKEHLEEFPIIIPPLSLQNEFTSIVTKIEEQKVLVKNAIDETQMLFDSLMSHYFEE